MKKQYIAPTQEVVTVKIDSMLLDGSEPEAGLDPNGEVDADGLDARRGSIWDE